MTHPQIGKTKPTTPLLINTSNDENATVRIPSDRLDGENRSPEIAVDGRRQREPVSVWTVDGCRQPESEPVWTVDRRRQPEPEPVWTVDGRRQREPEPVEAIDGRRQYEILKSLNP